MLVVNENDIPKLLVDALKAKADKDRDCKIAVKYHYSTKTQDCVELYFVFDREPVINNVNP